VPPTATDVTRSVVCVFVTLMCCAKMGEPIEIPFGGLTNMGPRNHYWMGVKFRCNPFAAAMGDKSAMRPFANLLSTLVFLVAVRSVQLTAWETRLQK